MPKLCLFIIHVHIHAICFYWSRGPTLTRQAVPPTRPPPIQQGVPRGRPQTVQAPQQQGVPRGRPQTVQSGQPQQIIRNYSVKSDNVYMEITDEPGSAYQQLGPRQSAKSHAYQQLPPQKVVGSNPSKYLLSCVWVCGPRNLHSES